MIICPICQTPNHHLAITCSSCKSFLQNRPENIELFSTTWRLFEQPRAALRSVALAHHKNLSLIVSSLAGPAIISCIYWLIKAGNHVDSFINLFVAGVVIGLPLGVVSNLFISLLLFIWMRITRKKIKLWNAFAVVGYAMIPLILASVVFFPLELMSFGQHFFGTNPSPYLLKPFIYILLLALNGLCIGWTLILLFHGLQVLGDYKVGKVLAIEAALILLYAAGIDTILAWAFPSLRWFVV